MNVMEDHRWTVLFFDNKVMNIKQIFPLLCLLLLTSCGGNSATAEKTEASPTANTTVDTPAIAETPPVSASDDGAEASVSFQETPFVLKFKNASDSEVVNEYFLAAESPDRWTKMVSVRHFPNINDPETAVGDLVNVIKQENPDAPLEIWNNAETGEVGIDFIVWQGDEIAEFNVFVYKASPTGAGLVAGQYAERAYGDQIEPFLLELKERRMPLVNETLAYSFPEVIE